MAKAFELKTMKASRLTARTAGIESTAKTTSVVSMRMSTAKSGVARRLPLRLVNSFWPSYSLVEGTNRRTNRSAGLWSGFTSASSCLAIFQAEYRRRNPKMKSTHSNRSISATPAKMKMARSTRAPKMPQKSTRNWYFGGTAKREKMTAQTKTLSTERLFSIR